ncbi:MAG: hypothetical protein ACR2HX_19420 [Pyrinomonadaceae bacterium]
MTFDPIREHRQRRAKVSQARAEALRQQASELMKEQARQTYVLSGGTLADFETEWPELRRQLLANEVVNESRKNEVNI